MQNVGDFIRRFHTNPEGLSRVRLGRGVVGNSTYIAIGAFAAISVVSMSFTNPWFSICSIIIVLIFATYLIRGTWIFADKHPDLAMLGDTEWLQYQTHIAGRDVSSAPIGPIIEAPDVESLEKNDE